MLFAFNITPDTVRRRGTCGAAPGEAKLDAQLIDGNESNNVLHSIWICHAGFEVFKQVLLPFLKGHAVACTPTVESRCIGTDCQLKSPGTEFVTDPFCRVVMLVLAD